MSTCHQLILHFFQVLYCNFYCIWKKIRHCAEFERNTYVSKRNLEIKSLYRRLLIGMTWEIRLWSMREHLNLHKFAKSRERLRNRPWQKDLLFAPKLNEKARWKRSGYSCCCCCWWVALFTWITIFFPSIIFLVLSTFYFNLYNMFACVHLDVIFPLGSPYSEKLWPKSWKCCLRPQAKGSILKPEVDLSIFFFCRKLA